MQLSNTSSPDHTGYQSPFLQARNTHFESVNFHDAIQSLKAPLSAWQRQKFFKEAISETLTWAVRCFAGIASEGKSILCIPLQVTALESVTATLESVTATLLSSRLRLEDSLCLLGIQDVQRLFQGQSCCRLCQWDAQSHAQTCPHQAAPHQSEGH